MSSFELGNETGFPHEGYIDFVDNRIDPNTGTMRARIVLKSWNPLLTPGFFVRTRSAVLECLALHAGEVVGKERLLQAIASWDEEITANAVEVYISRLRAKLGDAVSLRTVRGLGYRLDDADG